ncbi:MAG: hypothetical protein ABUS49_13030, partial [Acidobacteriota bacterium]
VFLLFASVAAMAFQGGWRDDREVAMDLRQNGAVRDREHTVSYYDAGALPDAAMDEFSALLDRGVEDISKFAGVPIPERKITYFISGRIDISRARGRSIYLPLERVRTHAAPYLHETTHILVPCEDCPLWLSEGYASFVQSYVSEHMGGYDGQIFTRNGNTGVDRDALRWLANDRGQAMLPFVGTNLEEPDLSDRRSVAAPFYVLSQSLVKYLVEKTGQKDLRALADIKDLTALREKWVSGLKG